MVAPSSRGSSPHFDKMRFPSLVALVSLASCAFAQDVSISDVVTAFNNANVRNLTVFLLNYFPYVGTPDP
jgi:hypothetical protein